jgi:transcriptional regulator with XRE-family HTH domain
MSKPFKNLIDKMPVERQLRIKRKAQTLKNQMVLAELRKALELTQGQLAETMQINQAAVSKFEHQSDLYISTLRKILYSMGADLKIIAQFPHADVEITQFNDLRNSM